jgi:hypothetical protein
MSGGTPVPRHDIHPRPGPRRHVTEVVDYTKGGHDRPGIAEPQLDYSKVPGWVRQDRVKAARMMPAHRPGWAFAPEQLVDGETGSTTGAYL